MTNKRKNDEGGGLMGMMSEWQARHKRRSRTVAIVIFGGLGVMTVLAVIIGFILAGVESANVRSAYGETIAGMCQTLPMGAPDPTNANAGQLLLLRANSGQRHPWHNQLPVGWRAETGDEVGMVGCVAENTEEIESCDYSRIGPEQDRYTVSIERMQTTTTITLLNPATGERAAEQTVIGSEPPPCPPDSDDLDTTQRLAGSEPTPADFQDWLAGFVDGTAN